MATNEAELRRRFQMDGPTVQERITQEQPEVAQAAAELHALSVRFGLGLDFPACLKMVQERKHESVE